MSSKYITIDELLDPNFATSLPNAGWNTLTTVAEIDPSVEIAKAFRCFGIDTAKRTAEFYGYEIVE